MHNLLGPPGKGEMSINNTHYQVAVKEAVKGKFYGHKVLNGKTVPLYPDSAEREMKRICNGYIRILYKSLEENLPELLNAYVASQRGDSRHDGFGNIERKAREVFQKIAEDLEQKFAQFGLYGLVARIARMTKNISLQEWKREVKETLGVEILDSYYSDEFYGQAVKQWVDDNVTAVQGIAGETFGNMKEIVVTGVVAGVTITAIRGKLQEQYKEARQRLRLLSRDQVSNLNSKISRMQFENAGCNKYRWSDSRDSRVRDCHRSLNGKVFSWNDPPEMWYDTKGRGRVYTGRRCHPGEDYCCRCIAVPVFDIDTVFVPITKTKG